MREELSKKAERRTTWVLWGGMAYMATQFGILARLTWWEYSWDIMEPVTYFITYGTAMAMYAYFVLTRQVRHNNTIIITVGSILLVSICARWSCSHFITVCYLIVVLYLRYPALKCNFLANQNANQGTLLPGRIVSSLYKWPLGFQSKDIQGDHQRLPSGPCPRTRTQNIVGI